MPRISNKLRRKLEDDIARDNYTLDYIKYYLMKKKRFSARAAKRLSLQIEKDGCDYWYSDEF